MSEPTIAVKDLSVLVDIPGGRFTMGSDLHYSEEAPAKQVEIAKFQMDAIAVTNEAFAKFVRDTGYVTSCEHSIDRSEIPDMPDKFYLPGSLVFRMTHKPVRLTDASQWWNLVPGACWKHPEGPGSSIDGRETHPVVHVSYDDALAYARWAGKLLPTEVQWEYAAARGVQTDEIDRIEMNVWRGAFPYQNDRVSRHPFTIPSKSLPPSRSGLFNMLGNVWEWTRDEFGKSAKDTVNCCTSKTVYQRSKVKVLKGGSYLCADTYCRRYRPSARTGLPALETAAHIGFRCVKG